MANKFTAIHLHLIFAPKFREARITPEVERHLYPYITTILRNRKHVLTAIGGTEDHLHLLVCLHPEQSISDLVRDVKANSSKLLNESKLLGRRFEWQGGVRCSKLLTQTRGKIAGLHQKSASASSSSLVCRGIRGVLSAEWDRVF